MDLKKTIYFMKRTVVRNIVQKVISELQWSQQQLVNLSHLLREPEYLKGKAEEKQKLSN